MAKLRSKFALGLAAVVCGAFFSINANASEPTLSAEQWLMRMAVESQKINYTGMISYQYGDQLVSAKMYQRFENGKGQRRLVFMDGQQDEMIDDGDMLKFVVNKSSQRSNHKQNQRVDGHIKSLPERLSKLSDAYTLKILDSKRIAGRDAVVVAIQPNDPFRYGHTLFIDKQTALLLKSETTDQNNKPLERFQFVQIDIKNARPIDQGQLQPSSFKMKHAQVSTVQFMPSNSEQKPLAWKANWIPKGYRLISSSHEEGEFSTCMYSDGMSSFSVFVEDSKKNFGGGVMHQGASVVVSRTVKIKNAERVATVVGDIPVNTADRIIQSIRADKKK